MSRDSMNIMNIGISETEGTPSTAVKLATTVMMATK
jgi:hypothetical protein